MNCTATSDPHALMGMMLQIMGLNISVAILSDNDCHKDMFDVTILVFDPQLVYVKYVTITVVYVSLQDASSYARI